MIKKVENQEAKRYNDTTYGVTHHVEISSTMRLHRKREKRGLKCVTLEIRKSEIAALVKRGLLADTNQGSVAALRNALYGRLDKTLQGSA